MMEEGGGSCFYSHSFIISLFFLWHKKKKNSLILTLHVSTEMEQNPTQDAGNLLQGKKKQANSE